MKQKSTGPVAHLKKFAKRTKKLHTELTLQQIQHSLAQHLGFRKWEELVLAPTAQLQDRINEVGTIEFFIRK